MRTGTININGVDYTTCFSTSVIIDIEDRGGTVDEFLTSIQEKGKVSDIFWLLSRMIAAGHEYLEMTGQPSAGTLTAHELAVLIAPEDYTKIVKCITDTMTASTMQKVVAEPPKNAETTHRTQDE